jgi:putative heme iron utilization protein
VEVALELLRELAKSDRMMWVVGGGEVVSENNSKGIKEPEVSGGFLTLEADNWHFHLELDKITGIQFVEAESHGDLLSYYVRLSNAKEETLVRGYFSNPYLDENLNRTDLQPDKLKVFEQTRDQYVGREGIVFVRRPRQPAG